MSTAFINMKAISSRLEKIIHARYAAIEQLDDGEASIHPAPGKWSKKEELGHLIDSALNNLRRFIVSQHEHDPRIIYAQEEWVRLNSYNTQPVLHLAEMWLLLNRQIVHVLSTMPEHAAQRTCNTGFEKPVLHSLHWLAEDYIKHLLHHLHHLLGLEPVAYVSLPG
jgi:hypothetical protein